MRFGCLIPLYIKSRQSHHLLLGAKLGERAAIWNTGRLIAECDEVGMGLVEGLKWLGTGAGILGALLIAANVPSSCWGFVLFLVSSSSWGVAALIMRETSLVLLQTAFTFINLLGIYRWLLI